MFSNKLFRYYMFNLGKSACRKLRHKPDFTKNTYPIERGFYNYLQEPHLKFFRSLLGDGERVLTDLSDLEKHNVDWFLQFRGSSSIVLKPKTTEEVSKILEYCNANKLAVCPQGGNTGVSGGGVPVFDEVILCTELMNKIIEIDEHTGSVVCQSGVVLETLDNALSDKGLMVPLDLGAKGSCHIGGNVATNAGGIRLLRYGNMHGNVLGLEIVKANGEVLDCLKQLKKDNSGLHLKNLFIGSEGTLGVITKVAINCPTRPKSQHVAFLGLQNYGKVLKTLKKAKQELGETLSAIEVMDAKTIEFAEEHINLTSPIGNYPFYLLIETTGSNEEHDALKLSAFLESALTQNYVLNGTMAGEPSKVKSIWAIRERLPEGIRHYELIGPYDFSLPVVKYYTIVDETRTKFKKQLDHVMGYGHLGDGNLHINVLGKKYDEGLKKTIDQFLIKRVLELKGSVSAEHGLGFSKSKYLPIVNSPGSYQLMKELKRLLDPNRILNPYKAIWEIRERIPEGFKRYEYLGLYDLSLPVTDFFTLVDETQALLKHEVDHVFGLGHLGDGNLHLNILGKKNDDRLKKMVEPFLIKRVLELRGSLSAEHGLGFLKSKFLPIVNSTGSYQLMRDLKFILDPNRILNPYKLFP